MIHQDAETTFETPHNNDLWDCLPDGADQDLLSDGCIRIATLNDLTAEWTGGIFDASGTHFYVSVQHNISGQATSSTSPAGPCSADSSIGDLGATLSPTP